MAKSLLLDNYFYIILAKFIMCSVFLQIHILTVEKRVYIVCYLSAQARKCRHAVLCVHLKGALTPSQQWQYSTVSF